MAIANLSAYNSTTWNFHQFSSMDSTAYDACAAQRYWPSGAPFLNPPYGWSYSGYWQSAVPTSIGTAWNPVGLVASPNPSALTIMRTHVPTVQ